MKNKLVLGDNTERLLLRFTLLTGKGKPAKVRPALPRKPGLIKKTRSHPNPNPNTVRRHVVRTHSKIRSKDVRTLSNNTS